MNEINLSNSPFAGFRSYDIDNKDFYFGREKYLEEALKKMAQRDFFAIIGPSGAGKSSFLKAGLAARFLSGAKKNRALAICRPGIRPAENLLASAARAVSTDGVTPPGEIDISSFDGLKKHISASKSEYLFAFEKFDDIARFSEYYADKPKIAEYLSFIEWIARESASKVIISMRAEFLDGLAEYGSFFNLIKENNYYLPRISREEIKGVASGLLKAAGITKLSPDKYTIDKAAAPGLTSIQLALARAANKEKANPGPENTLGLSINDIINGASVSVSQACNELYNKLSGREEKNALPRILRALISKGGKPGSLTSPLIVEELSGISGISRELAINIINKFSVDKGGFLQFLPNTAPGKNHIVMAANEAPFAEWDKLKEWAADEKKAAAYALSLGNIAPLFAIGRKDAVESPEYKSAEEWFLNEKPTQKWIESYGGDYSAIANLVTQGKSSREKHARDYESKSRKKMNRAKKAAFGLGAVSLLAITALLVVVNVNKDLELKEKSAKMGIILAEREKGAARKKLGDTYVKQRALEQEKDIFSEEKALAISERDFFAASVDEFRNVLTETNQQAEKFKKERDSAYYESDKAKIHMKEALVKQKISAARKKIAEDEKEKANLKLNEYASLRKEAAGKNLANYAARLEEKDGSSLQGLLAAHAYELNKESGGGYNPALFDALYKAGGEQLKMKAHNGGVGHLAIANRGRIFATYGGDGKAYLWNLIEPGQENRAQLSLYGGVGALTCLIFSHNDEFLAAGSSSGEILIWEVTKKSPEPFVLSDHDSPIAGLAFIPKSPYMISVSRDGSIRLWNLKEANERAQQIYHADFRVAHMCQNPVTGYLAIGGENGQVIEFRKPVNCSEPISVANINKKVTAMKYSRDGSKLSAGTLDGKVYIWNRKGPPTGSKVLNAGGGMVASIDFNHTEPMLAASSGGAVKIWNLNNLNEIPVVINFDETSVSAFEFAKFGTAFLTSGQSGFIHYSVCSLETLFDAAKKKLTRNLREDEWKQYVGPGIEYRKARPDLP